MIGSIRWNFLIGAIAFVITFFLSVSKNIWMTTLIRSFYSFLVLFVLIFFFRWLLGTFAGIGGASASDEELEEEQLKGKAVDALTPDENDELHRMLKQSMDPGAESKDIGFSPLNPPKLSTKVNSDPEELAQALRRMSED